MSRLCPNCHTPLPMLKAREAKGAFTCGKCGYVYTRPTYSLAQNLINSSTGELFSWWAKTSPPDNKAKEVIPGGGGIAKRGESKSGRKRKKPKKLTRMRQDLWGC